VSSPSVGVEADESEPERLGDFGLVKGTEEEGRVTALDIGRFRRGVEGSVEYPSESD